MNERIKELAEQAALKFSKDWGECYTGNVQIERFAELVRQDEAKTCAEHYVAIMRDAVTQARLDEREACAKACEKVHDDYINDRNNDGYDWPDGRDCADAIRARCEK